MSQHVILNPVPTPEQMADLLGISHDRVEALRGIMRSASASSPTHLAKSRKSGARKAAATSNSRNAKKNASGAATTR